MQGKELTKMMEITSRGEISVLQTIGDEEQATINYNNKALQSTWD